MGRKVASYGSWSSPVTAALLAEAGVRLGWLQCSGGETYWVEGRPLEDGRYVVVRRASDGTVSDVTPAGYNARTLVHEYGGGMDVLDETTVYFSNYADQRLYRQDGGGTPVPITPEPSVSKSVRYADGRVAPGGRLLICVRESHSGNGSVVNELVVLPTDGATAPVVIASGCDFYSNPRISPDGEWLAWMSWDHPRMPWDGTELWVAPLGVDGLLGQARIVAGGEQESIFQPEWSPVGVLHFVSDRSNWWNLYREVDNEVQAIAPMEAEFGGAQWVFGLSHYSFLSDGRIACIYGQGGYDHLGIIDTESGSFATLQSDYTSLSSISTDGSSVWLIGASPTKGSTVLRVDPTGGGFQEIRRAMEVNFDAAYFSVPEALDFPVENGKISHAFYYAPTNPAYKAPDGELPPLIVISHGGPTGATEPHLSLGVQYWTTRGFGVVDVNYGGSTGYGREYRERLRRNWGIVDVEDCIHAARYLMAQGRVDPARIGIRGGSAGGYTTLRALTWKDFFAVGASYYGLAELEVFVHDTHKFESRYLDGLIGSYPDEKDEYYNRSPVNLAENLGCPLILFQGLEDKVVPPSQAEIMVKALNRKKLPYTYLAFEGEQHGFRKAKNIIRSAEAELYFYSRVLGFDLGEVIDPVEIANLR